MKYIAICILAVIGITGCVTGPPSSFYRYEVPLRTVSEPPYLQVKLTAYSDVTNAVIKIDSPYLIYEYAPERNSAFTSSKLLADRQGAGTVKVGASSSGISWGNRDIAAKDIVIVPTSGLISLAPRAYRGRLRIKAVAGKITLINIIDMESYLPGVVSSEMDESWPAEALAAQAITARSFAFYRIKQSKLKTSDIDCDLTDDIYSQVYRGEERTGSNTRRAVQETRGIIIAYNGKIFNSLFHDTCGGRTEPGELVFKLTPLPPLSGRVCGFCGQSKFTNWQARYTQPEIIQALKLDKSTRIEDIKITKTAPGGHGLEFALTIAGRRDDMLWEAQKFRIALNPNRFRSTLVRISKSGNDFELTGHGWGHAVGMCQEGARGMSLANSTPLAILEYYYPEVKVVKIY